jgi:hypothetical protein
MAHLVFATASASRVNVGIAKCPSLLCKGFNDAWASALQLNEAGAAQYFLLHHDDIEVRTPHWLDVLVDEAQRTGAAVLSVVQPIKTDEVDETSTAMGHPTDPWSQRKFSLREIGALPETFCAADTRWPHQPLLVNTGLMLVDLSRPEFHEVDADGFLRFRFTIQDRVRKSTWKAECLSEDWYFSRQCWEAGLPVYCTRRVECGHWGAKAWSNQPPPPAPPKNEIVSASAPMEKDADDHYYQHIQGWFDFPDVYREAVARTPDGGTLVEVGCWRGKSLSFLCVEAVRSGKTLTVFGVDHFGGSVDQPGMLREAAAEDLGAECLLNVRRSGHRRTYLLEMPSLEAAAQLPDASLDFVFIDGSHDHESVIADIRAWLPKVKPGGVLAGHDYDLRTDPGVVTAVNLCLTGFKVVGRCWWYDVPKGE